MYISRAGDGPVMVCAIQMGQIHGTLDEAIDAAGGVSRLINTEKCPSACSGLIQCKCAQ